MQGGEMICRILELFPVGVKFQPSDPLLVGHYLRSKIEGKTSELKMKILGNDSQVDIIPELDVCEWEPWELRDKLNHPVFSGFPTDDPVWFFFSPLHKKPPNGRLFKRETKAGHWKSTGQDRKIKRRATEEEIGYKKTLVFHRGRGPSAVSTGWIIHEYRARTASLPNNNNYVLCRLKSETGSGFPPETNFNGMLPEMPFIQATSPMNMEVDNSSTGTGILQNVPAHINTSGAERIHPSSNIASDIRNYELDDMIPEDYAMLDERPLTDLAIDSDGYPYDPRRDFDSGNLRHFYIGRVLTFPQTPLEGAYGKGGGSSSDTHTQVAQAEIQIWKGKGSFNFPDTASAGHEPSSSSGYLVNSLVGILLLVILIAVMVRNIHAKFSKPWF